MTLASGSASLTLGPVSSSTLGATDVGGTERTLVDLRRGGALALDGGDTAGTLAVLGAARSSIAMMRAEAGAYARHTIAARSNDLAVSAENVASARSMIRDADMAGEVARLNRAETLLAAGLASARASARAGGMIIDLFG